MGGWVKSFICFVFFFLFLLFFYLYLYYHRSDRIGGYLIMGCCSVFGVWCRTPGLWGAERRGSGEGEAPSANETRGFKHFHNNIIQIQNNAIGPNSQSVFLE